MGKNAFYVVLFCGRSDMCHLPSLSQVAKHKQHVSSVGDDHFYSGGGSADNYAGNWNEIVGKAVCK